MKNKKRIIIISTLSVIILLLAIIFSFSDLQKNTFSTRIEDEKE